MSRHAYAVVVAVVAIGWAPHTSALSGYYTTYCAGCHGAAVSTCNGCHSHGTHSTSSKTDINVAGTLNKTTFAPGETVTVTVTGGYRSGWVRVVLLDANMTELARSTCATGSGIPQGCTTSQYPVTMSHAAPTTAGTYTWAVAWYGNYQYEGTGASFGSGTSATLQPGFFTPDTGNSNHGYQVVALPSFTVAAAAAPAISVNPTSLAFGAVAIGSHVDKTVTISNTGTATLTVSNIALGSGTSSEYTVTPTSVSVNAGESHAFTVTYTPTDTTTDDGSITITSNDPGHPTTAVTVSGSGTTTPVATIAVNPASLAFGDIMVGSHDSKAITVSNSGSAALTGTVAFASGTSAEYTVSPSSLNVASGATQTVTVTYTPVDETTDNGQVVITSNDPAHATVNVALSGTGVTTATPKITLTPTSLDFGTIDLGSTKQLTAQIGNSGTGTLNVTGITRCASPATSTEFTWSPQAPFAVAPGQSTTLTVTYTANDPATEVGCLAISSDDQQNATVNLAVTGSGQAAATTDGGGGVVPDAGTDGGTEPGTGGTTSKSGGGCSTGQGSVTMALLILLAALAIRRRIARVARR